MRSKALDLVKYIYMMIICLWHTGWVDSLCKGYSPVEFFFIVSGFFLYKSSVKGLNLMDYMKSRLMRLYPAFIISLMLYVILLKEPYNILDFLYEASLIRDVVHIDGMNTLNRVIWFVSVLYWGGLLVMSLLKCTRNVLFFLIVALLIYGTILIHCGNFNDTFQCVGIFYVPFWRGIAGLLLGVAMALLTNKINQSKVLGSYIRLFGKIGLLAFVLSLLLMFLPYRTELLSLSCYCIILLSCMICDMEVLNRIPVLPDITYEMFLLHLIIIKVAVKLLDTVGLLGSSLLKYFTFIVILLVASYILNRVAEYLRRLIR